MTSSSQAWKRPKSPSAGARSLISHLQPGQKIVPALRPTFRFIAAVEDECGCGIARLVRDFIAGEWKVSHLVTILTAGLAHDDGVDPRDVRDAVVAKGAMHFVPAALTLCANIMTDEDVRPAVPDRALATPEPPDDARAGTDAAP